MCIWVGALTIFSVIFLTIKMKDISMFMSTVKLYKFQNLHPPSFLQYTFFFFFSVLIYLYFDMTIQILTESIFFCLCEHGTFLFTSSWHGIMSCTCLINLLNKNLIMMYDKKVVVERTLKQKYLNSTKL